MKKKKELGDGFRARFYTVAISFCSPQMRPTARPKLYLWRGLNGLDSVNPIL